MAWIVGILGFGAGAIVAYLLAERRCRGLIADLQRQCAVLEEKLGAREQELLRQQALLDTAEARLREAFASLSSDALQRNNEAFLHLAREKFAALSAEAVGSLEQRKAQIEGLLKPMQELLNTYQARLAELEKSRVESYSMLREQLGTLAETQRSLSLQTTQLVTALRRPTTRGQWGEITLRRLVELAGMTPRCDFVEQGSVDTEEGRQRPDVVVHLPGDRQIVIDCKVALDAFLDAAAAPDEDTRRLCLSRHARQVRSRAVELGAKSYWNQFSRCPEYVVMFLPGEAFLYAAVEQDGSLIEDCLKNRVIVATPTTLIALLKAIEFGWRQEQLAENAEEIRRHGKDLYDRIAVLATHFSKLGTSLEQSVKCYNELLGSLESRVMVTARKIGELGARSDKQLPDLAPIDRQPREPSATLRAVSEST
ncbi:MAG TPA: DNA recombination protein RmuC [Tepidisphaeraceae bacterium]|nr:DNA recombination protein RmuC [Tepidisphaeraceae bacterium]